MPFFQNEQTIAANATVANILAGSIFEYAPYNCQILVAFTGAATGLICSVTTGSDVVAEPFPPFVLTTFPVFPDQFVIADLVQAQERIVFSVRNTTGAGIVLRTSMQLTPVR